MVLSQENGQGEYQCYSSTNCSAYTGTQDPQGWKWPDSVDQEYIECNIYSISDHIGNQNTTCIP